VLSLIAVKALRERSDLADQNAQPLVANPTRVQVVICHDGDAWQSDACKRLRDRLRSRLDQSDLAAFPIATAKNSKSLETAPRPANGVLCARPVLPSADSLDRDIFAVEMFGHGPAFAALGLSRLSIDSPCVLSRALPAVVDMKSSANAMSGLLAYAESRYNAAVVHLRAALKRCLRERSAHTTTVLQWLGLAYLAMAQESGMPSQFAAARLLLNLTVLRIRREGANNVVAAIVLRALARSYLSTSKAHSINTYNSRASALRIIDEVFLMLDANVDFVEQAYTFYDRACIYLGFPDTRDDREQFLTIRSLQRALDVFDQQDFPVEYAHCVTALGQASHGRARRSAASRPWLRAV
jgi:hypothetical protein